jgi:transposase InsO family protein
VGSTHHS